jgi:hypothetical protein
MVQTRVRFRLGLTPVAFHQNPAALLVDPAMGYPAAMLLRRLFPVSRCPRIGIALPAVIPGHPDVITARSRSSAVRYGMRRPDSYCDICRSGAEDERARKHQSDESIKNHTSCYACAWPYANLH